MQGALGQSQPAVLRSPSSEQAAPPGLQHVLGQNLRGPTMRPTSLLDWLWSRLGRMASSSWDALPMPGQRSFRGLARHCISAMGPQCLLALLHFY